MKKIGLNVVTLTYDLEIQGQTWRNALNTISLVVYKLYCRNSISVFMRIKSMSGIQKLCLNVNIFDF